VRDSQGKFVADARISLQAKDPAQVLATHSDLQGNYGFSGLAAGLYTLQAETDELGSATVPSIVIVTGESRNVDLTLSQTAGASDPASSGASAPTPPAQTPQFFDQPQFTVSGVTDTTNLGGHGSDAIVKTRDALSKEAAALAISKNKPEHGAASDYENAYDLVLAHANAGDYHRALDEARALLAHNDRAELHDLAGTIDEKLGNSLDAVREYQHATQLDPREQYFFDWGSELLLHHAPEPALDVFTEGNRRFPDSARMLIGLGAAWFARGDYDEAVRRIGEASDLNRNDPTAYLFLGKILAAQRDPSKDLVGKLHRFVVLQPRNAQANYYYAVGLWKLRADSHDGAATVQAESLLKTAIQLEPKFADAYLQLGIIHSDQSNYPEAIADYKSAIRADPESEDAHYRLAQAYRHIGAADMASVETELYRQIAKKSAEKADRQRHEIQQFVYTLRDQSPVQVR
jgi:tetratricopeptide (TPR) repeat protein